MAGAATTPTTKGGSALSLGLAVGILIVAGIALSRCGGAEEAMTGGQVVAGAESLPGNSSGGSTVPPTQRVETVEIRAEPSIVLAIPAATDEYLELSNRENWTLCLDSNREGIEVLFKGRNGSWTNTWPTSGRVYGWRFRSLTAQERTLGANWDMSPSCSTPVPS